MKTTRAERQRCLEEAKRLPVPKQYEDARLEWQEGMAHGLAGSSRENPVKDTTVTLGKELYFDWLRRREAWSAGRAAGREERKRRLKAAEAAG